MRGVRGGRENQNQRQSAREKKKGKISPGNERKKVKRGSEGWKPKQKLFTETKPGWIIIL